MEMKATGSGIGWRRHRECDGLPVSKCQYEETRLDITVIKIILLTIFINFSVLQKQMLSVYYYGFIHIHHFDSLAPFIKTKKLFIAMEQ